MEIEERRANIDKERAGIDKERINHAIATTQQTLDLFDRLGGLDERDKLFFRDSLRSLSLLQKVESPPLPCHC